MPVAQPYRPLLKFVCFKTVIFLTFWQASAFSGLNGARKGAVTNSHPHGQNKTKPNQPCTQHRHRPPPPPRCDTLCVAALLAQSLAISFFATRFHMSPSDSEALMNWIIVVEMLMAAIGMFFAFHWNEYSIGGQAAGWRLGAISHAISITDVVGDIIHQASQPSGAVCKSPGSG